ncbi:MAG: hypothetical protein IID06_08615, partial [Gemmatimonadetes bacterium]|nr:hypothetical protein [Gemmatimonadota bacterium]
MQLFVGAVLAGLAVVPRGVVSQDTSGYRQQEVRYLVPARLDELTGTLSARETTSHDWNFTNNLQRGFLDFGDAKFRWDTFFSEPAARDRKVISIAPTFWWNDASDATVGVRLRSNYMGRYDRTTLWLIRGVSGFEEATSGDVLDIYFKLENPLFLRDPRASQSLELWSQEGTVGARLEFSKAHRRSSSSPNVRNSGWTAQWVATRQTN